VYDVKSDLYASVGTLGQSRCPASVTGTVDESKASNSCDNNRRRNIPTEVWKEDLTTSYGACCECMQKMSGRSLIGLDADYVGLPITDPDPDDPVVGEDRCVEATCEATAWRQIKMIGGPPMRETYYVNGDPTAFNYFVTPTSEVKECAECNCLPSCTAYVEQCYAVGSTKPRACVPATEPLLDGNVVQTVDVRPPDLPDTRRRKGHGGGGRRLLQSLLQRNPNGGTPAPAPQDERYSEANLDAACCERCNNNEQCDFWNRKVFECKLKQTKSNLDKGLDEFFTPGHTLYPAYFDLEQNLQTVGFLTNQEFKFSFDIRPFSKKGGGFANIFTVTANGHGMGRNQRIPMFSFYPSSTRMHIRMGRLSQGSGGCDPAGQLDLNEWTNVQLMLKGQVLTVLYNGKQVCRSESYTDPLPGGTEVTLYASIGNNPADAEVMNIEYGRNNMRLDNSPGKETLTITRGYQVSGVGDGHSEFALSFELYPRSKAAGGNIPSNIVQVGTGCDHGFKCKTPAIYFAPGTTKLRVRMGRHGNSNDGCEVGEELPLNQWSTVRVQLTGRDLRLFQNNVEKCRVSNYGDRYRLLDNIKMYVSHPHNPAVNGDIRNLQYHALDQFVSSSDEGDDAEWRGGFKAKQESNDGTQLASMRGKCKEEDDKDIDCVEEKVTNWYEEALSLPDQYDDVKGEVAGDNAVGAIICAVVILIVDYLIGCALGWWAMPSFWMGIAAGDTATKAISAYTVANWGRTTAFPNNAEKYGKYPGAKSVERATENFVKVIGAKDAQPVRTAKAFVGISTKAADDRKAQLDILKKGAAWDAVKGTRKMLPCMPLAMLAWLEAGTSFFGCMLSCLIQSLAEHIATLIFKLVGDCIWRMIQEALDKAGLCFPADAQVQLESGKTTEMMHLKVGDRVLTGDGTYQDVYFFAHETLGVVVQYVALTLESKEILMATAAHYLPVSAACDGKMQHMTASQVKQHMCLVSSKHGLQPVTKVEAVQKLGIYNPYTMSGDIVVNGVLASSHSSWFLDDAAKKLGLTWATPSIYQAMLAPARGLYYAVGPAVARTELKAYKDNMAVAAHEGLVVRPYFDLMWRAVQILTGHP